MAYVGEELILPTEKISEVMLEEQLSKNHYPVILLAMRYCVCSTVGRKCLCKLEMPNNFSLVRK